VADDHGKADGGNCPARQADECRKRDHRRADREDDLDNEVVEFETESPAKTNDGER
jgi:hypothetical protein